MSKPQSKAKSKSKLVSKTGGEQVPEHAPPSPARAAFGTLSGSSTDQTAQSTRPNTIYCTIAAAKDLPQALLLRDSILATHGALDFRLLLVEHPAVVARLRPQLPGVTVLGPDEIGCAQWLQMAFYYDLGEYSTALKAALLRSLLRDGNVVYFDPDIEVFAPLTELETLLQESDVVVTPHVTELLPEDGCTPTMRDLLRRGEFDLGFIGIQKGAAGERLLTWWQEQLVEGAQASAADGLFPDQLGAAAFASAAPRLQVVRSLRYNLSYANVGLSDFQWDGSGGPQTKDGPLVFYHYAGLLPAEPEKVSRFQNRLTAPSGSPLYTLLARYVSKLQESPYRNFAALPYSFDRYIGGAPILPQHRRALLHLPRANRQLIYNPFTQEQYLAQLASQPHVQCSRCLELEGRLNRLPHSLVGYAGQAMDLLLPGSRDRLYGLMQGLSPQHGNVRYYATKALDLVMPGSRDRLYNAMKAAAKSPNPAIRRTAALMLGTAA